MDDQYSNHQRRPQHNSNRTGNQPYNFPSNPNKGEVDGRRGGGAGNPQLGLPEEQVFDGKSLRKSVQRKTVDYAASQIRFLHKMPWYRDKREYTLLNVDPTYSINMLPPSAQTSRSSNGIVNKFVSNSANKVRCPANVVKWTPEGRRLITGCSTGEFTLWNGLTFNFETILQAHESAVRAMEWSHNSNWMVTADHNGVIKYWQSNMNNLKEFQGHDNDVRGISFSVSDAKFASCSDDSTIKIWNFDLGLQESVLRGHSSDVRAVDWHPYKSLIASGSKDSTLRLWDPKSGKALTSLHSHKSAVHSVKWNKNGNWLVSTAKDQLIKVYDVRVMKEFLSLRGHRKEASTVAWHPHYERFFATGGSDGAIMFWDLCTESPVGQLKSAHDTYIWSLDWHPVGHILASGSADNTTRFWTRPRPGEIIRNSEGRFHGGYAPPDPTKDIDMPTNQAIRNSVLNDQPSLPGLGKMSLLPTTSTLPGISNNIGTLPSLPGLGLL